MDRPIIYPGQVPLETDLLRTNRFAMTALAMLTQDLVGTSTQVSGFTCIPTGPATMAVQVTPGRIYSLQNLDSTAYSSLAADTTHQIVKQGILLDAVTLACAAPTTAGYSINYLIEATYQDTDATPVALPYYNSSNPAQAYSGPNGSGAAQSTLRTGAVVLQAKAGIAATTGSQVTPAADSGYVGLFVVTVAYGTVSIAAGAISTYSGSPGLGIDASKITATQTGTGAVSQTALAMLRERVSITQFGAVMNVSTAGQRAINSAALLAALAVSRRVRIPAGTLWVAAGTVLPGFWNITGEGTQSTFIKGDGDLLLINTADNGEMRLFHGFTILNDVTPGKLISNVGTTNRVQFQQVNFGAANYHVYSSGGDAVSWRFENCRFTGHLIESRHFEGLWVYYESGCYTWFGAIGLRCTNGNVVGCSSVGSTYEQHDDSAIVLEATGAFEVDGFTFGPGCELEANGKVTNKADILVSTASVTRVRNVTLFGSTLGAPTATQTVRVKTTAGGGGNLALINIRDVCLMGSVPLCTDTASVTADNVYYQAAAAPTQVIVPAKTPQYLSNWLGEQTVVGPAVGSSAVVVTITPPAGVKMIDFTVQGNFYNGVANSHTGYLIGKYVASGSRIVILSDVNNGTGTAQGFIATWTGTAIQIANKAGMTASQSGDVTCIFHG